MPTYAPTTELEAVNIMLGTIGEAPISSLSITGAIDVSTAQQILNETNRSVQSEQWEYNTEYEYTLTPDVNGLINLPTNILKIDITNDYTSSYQPVIRGTKLYDKLNHTFVFTKALTFDIVWLLPFTDLPESLRYYIAIVAARRFQRRYYSSETINSFTQEDEMRARAEALSSDTSVADYNMTQNYTVYQVLDR